MVEYIFILGDNLGGQFIIDFVHTNIIMNQRVFNVQTCSITQLFTNVGKQYYFLYNGFNNTPRSLFKCQHMPGKITE